MSKARDLAGTITSSGIDVTGSIIGDGLTVDGDAVISSANARLRLKETDTTDNDTQLQTTGGVFKVSRLDDNNATATQRFTIDNATGDVSLYEDTGTTPKFFWDASAESLGIGTSSPSDYYSDNLVVSSPTENGITIAAQATTNTNYLMFADGTSGDARYRGYIGYLHANDAFAFGTSGSEKMRIDSSGNVGIGTNSPDLVGSTTSLTINNSGGNGQLSLMGNGTVYGRIFADNATGDLKMGNPTSNDVMFYTANLERMRIDSSGNVGIGTSSTNAALDVTRSGGFSVTSMGNGTTRLNVGVSSDNSAFLEVPQAQPLRFLVNNADRMRITSSGNVGIGVTPSAWGGSGTLQAVQIKSTSLAGSGTNAYWGSNWYGGGFDKYIENGAASLAVQTGGQHIWFGAASGTADNAISFSERMRIDSSGRVGIGTSSPNRLLSLYDTQPVFQITNVASGNTQGTIQYQVSGSTQFNIDNQGSGSGGVIAFMQAGLERMRIDSSGNLLVGTTDNSVYNNSGSGTGINLQNFGNIAVARNNDDCMVLNRLNSDGSIALFNKNGATVGIIGTYGSTTFIQSGASASYAGLLFNTNSVEPARTNGISGSNPRADNVLDLGSSVYRFDDVYATNGTIQTSDANEKQQIASLTDAEMTAAKAISKLFKTFKWNDSVTEKGDAARTHTGVIAQDVAQAMTDAGLDAGNYAFWMSNTWWETQTEVPAVAEELDEDGNVITEAKEAYTRTDTYDTLEEAPEGATEHTRLGIRYPELLAFIGAATEQRLTSIETRLDALETP